MIRVLRRHEEVFQNRKGNYTGGEVSIHLCDDAQPVWSKSYPIALKNRKVFEDEIYLQCDIGAMRELAAEKIDECDWCFPLYLGRSRAMAPCAWSST